MNGYIYNATKNEREVLDSEKLRLIIKTEGNKTVIDGGKIMTNSITAKSISANSIYAEHISTDAIKTGHVSAGSIVSTHIKAEAILSTHIQSDTILARHIKADQINSNHIIANTILAKHIKANEIEAKHIKAGEVILPDEKYGGVYINSTGLNMINSANHIALSAEKGLKIHNSLKGKTVFWANPTTGDIEMDVNKLTINSSDVYTQDNLIIGGTNIFRGKPKNEDLISKVNNTYFDSYNFLTEVGEQVPIEPEVEYIFTADVQMISSTINSLMVSFGYANKDGNFIYDGTSIHHDAKIKNQKIKQVIKFKKLTENQINSGATYNLAIRFTRGAQVHTSEAIYSNIKLEKGNISTEWSPSPKDLLDLEKIKSGRNNLFILSTSEIGYIDRDGNIQLPDAEQLTSDFIKVDSKKNYILQNWVTLDKDNTRIWNSICYYDKDKKFINREVFAGDYRNKNYEDYLINNLKFNKETMYVRISSSFIEYFNNKVLFQEGNIPSDWNLAYEDTLNVNSKNMLSNSKGNNLKDYSPWADTKISIENNFIKSYMSGKALYGITTPYLEEPIYKNKIYNFSFEIDNSLGEVSLNYLFLIDNNGANNQLLKSQTSKNGKINIVFISKRDNLKPRFLIGLDNRVTGKESYPESFKIKYLNFKEGINSSDWTEAPQSQMNKEEINSRFILENQKIELGINTKIDNIQVGGVNLQEKTSNSIKYSSFKGWNAYLEPSSGPYKKGDVLTLSGYLISGINDVGLRMISTAETGNIIEYGQTNMIPPNSEGNVTSTVTVPVDTKNIKIVLRHNSGEAPESKTGYRSIQLERGNKQTDWSPSPKDSYNKEETDAKIKIETDKIELNVNKKVDGLAPPTNNLLLNSKTKSSSVNGQYTFVTLKGIDSESLEGHYTKLEPGEQYTITTRAKASSKGETRMYLQNIPEYNFSQVITFSSQELETKSVTFRIPKTSPVNQKWSIAIYDIAKLGGSYHEWTTLTKGNMTSPDWIDSSGDSYNKTETDAKIKIESDNIKLGVTEEIKYSGLGNENLIYNSSMNNVYPYILINGVKHYNFYKCNPSFVYGGWTKMKANTESTDHILDIGTSNTGISHAGSLINYGWSNIKEGDFITFSGELNNINTNRMYLEIYLGTGSSSWGTSIKSPIITEKGIFKASVTVQITKDVKAVLFRVNMGSTPNGEIDIRNLMATKGSVPQDWRANPSDLLNNVYNPNLFENSNFDETLSIGTVAKNADNYARRWTMYNGGIENATTNYHSYISDSKFGFNVMVFDESDGTRHWKAAHQSLNAEDIKIVQTGGNLWFSLDMYKEGNSLGNARVWGGMYYYNKAGTRGFHAGQPILYSTIVGEWERVSASVPFNPNDVDWTKEILFYIYGYTFTDNSKLYIKNVKLEIGKYVTPYELASKDVVKISEFKDVQLSLEPDAITQTVTSSQTFSEWSDEAIGGKANQVDLDATNNELEKTKEEVITTVDKVGELKTQADGIEGSVTTITKRVEGQEKYTEKTKKFFTFDDDFLTIKKSDSLFNINITNEQMSFRNGKVETAFINGQKLFITEAQILNTIIVGSHQIQTDPATKQTIFKYIG